MILFGNKVQRLEINRLKEDLREANRDIITLEDKIADNDIKVAKIRTDNRLKVDGLLRDHKIQIQNKRTEHEVELNTIQSILEKLEEKFDARVDKEVVTIKKDYNNKTKELDKKSQANDKAQIALVKKLEAEYAAKIAKCDRDLESEKVSYRKYLRSEFNANVEKLEKDNTRLTTENAILSDSNKGLERTNGILEEQIESVTEFADTVAGSMSTLSTKIVEGLVKSMPTVSAEITTPEVNVNLPAQATPQGGNKQGGGGEQKKNN